ncbi:hypothetical protein WA158_001555 [Blastocystis sp. Blastoise]
MGREIKHEEIKHIHPSTDLKRSNDSDKNAKNPTLCKRELISWYLYDFANSVYSSVALSGFLSLALQEIALANAGFPEICPNVECNADLVHQYFEDSSCMYYMKTASDVIGCKEGNNGVYCPGTPASGFCYESDGITQYILRATLGSISVDPNSYFSLTLTISKIIQVILFLLTGAMADFGGMRRLCLNFWTLLGTISSLFLPFMTKDAWWVGFFVVLFSNTSYGISIVFYNSYLPLLSQSHPLCSNEKDKDKKGAIDTKIQDEMSSTGFLMGYIAGFVVLIVCVPIVYFLGTSGYIWSCFLAGVWWLVFSIPTFLYLKKRPGPDLPKGEHYITYNFKRYGHTCASMLLLPNAFRLLLAWFLYSDSFSTITSLAILMANTYVNWYNIPRSIGLVLLMIESPVAASIGTWFFLTLTRKNLIKGKTIIYICLTVLLFVCIYPCLLTSETLLPILNPYWYMLILCAIFGFILGPVQSYSRSVFSSLIPAGHESEFFALYEISDRGSSWIGPLAISLFSTYLNNMLYCFYLELIMVILAFIVFYFVDVEKGKKEARLYEAMEDGAKKLETGIKGKITEVMDTVKDSIKDGINSLTPDKK